MYKFHSLGKPAARVGDTHSCPKIVPGTQVPHVGGPVIVAGCMSVFIEGRPAATKGDTCMCVVEPDAITTGSTGVFIEGKPAARMGDHCGHGGVIVSGSRTVWIGDIPEEKKGAHVFFNEKQIKAINKAIQRCTALLERKEMLLEQNDPETVKLFKKWFGLWDEEAKLVIRKRIERALNVSRNLSIVNFERITDDHEKRDTCAIVYSEDKLHRFKLGDKFWDAKASGKSSKAGTLIHELSHFDDVGGTEDATYGRKDCLQLAKKEPKTALNNADSFEYFVIA